MTRKRRRPRPPEKKALPVAQWGVIAGVVVLVGAILILKAHRSGVGPATPLASQPMSVAIEVTPAEGEYGTPPLSPTPTLLPEAQLNQLLAAGEPAFVFFHSNNCVQCVRMIEIVEQVYPDFSDEVALVDVNVYDENNRNLLYRAGIRAIPTLIFIDHAGQAQGYVGVMDAAALREQLQALAGE